MNQGHFCYICVDLPEVAQQEAAFLGIFFCVEEATAATIPFSLHKTLFVLKNAKFISQQC